MTELEAETKGWYKFELDCGRMGTLTGTLVLTREEYQSLLGRNYSVSDVLGKHSEIEFEVEPEDLKLLTEDADFLLAASRAGVPLNHGFNFRACYCIDDEEEEEEDSDD